MGAAIQAERSPWSWTAQGALVGDARRWLGWPDGGAISETPHVVSYEIRVDVWDGSGESGRLAEFGRVKGKEE